MVFTEVLTFIFVLLKVFNIIDWSWWLVFLPEITAGAFYMLLTIRWMHMVNKNIDEHQKIMDDMWK